ncbi:MAG: hypothetical protein NT178_06710 [Proteobacteria bacterium]|nr:hypothetical protein [Pseudomonadota bacterium]
MDEIRNEIKKIEESAEKLRILAGDNNAIAKNASIIQKFVYILKFITPVVD